jgi:hypothetical protein
MAQILRSILLSLAVFVAWNAENATGADLMHPQGVGVRADGQIWIVDRKFHGIFALKDGQLTPVYEGLAKFRTPLNAVACIHVAADGKTYVGDSATREVYLVRDDGKLTALTSGQGSNVPRDEYHPGKIGVPTQIATMKDGAVLATDLELQRVWKIPAGGGEPQEFAVLAGARGVAVDAEDHVWILTANAPQLRRFTPDGKTSEEIVKELTFNFPLQLAVRPEGEALVTDGYGPGVWKVSKDGKAEKLAFGPPFTHPVGICLTDGGKKALVIDPKAPGLFEIGEDGAVKKLYPAAAP